MLSKIIKECNARINSFEFLKKFFCEDSHGSKKSSAPGLEYIACTICIFYETRWRDVELSIVYLTCRSLLYIYTLRSKARQIKPPALRTYQHCCQFAVWCEPDWRDLSYTETWWETHCWNMTVWWQRISFLEDHAFMLILRNDDRTKFETAIFLQATGLELIVVVTLHPGMT